MRITILAVGQHEPAWANSAVKDYLSRFPKGFTVELHEIKTEPRAGQPVSRLMTLEAERLRKAIPAGDLLVVLDEHGKDITTADFAKRIENWKDEAQSVTFVIGGPDGLDAELKRSAQLMLRLSSMTLPHALARVLLCEQIYRAWSIINKHPYHRA